MFEHSSRGSTRVFYGRFAWHLFVVLGVEGLPYQYLWISAWLRDKQPMSVALTLPLLKGELFVVAAVIWLLAAARLLIFGVTMARRAPLRWRIHWAILAAVVVLVLVPIVAFFAKDDGRPLGGFGLRIEEVTIVTSVLFSAWVRLFTLAGNRACCRARATGGVQFREGCRRQVGSDADDVNQCHAYASRLLDHRQVVVRLRLPGTRLSWCHTKTVIRN